KKLTLTLDDFRQIFQLPQATGNNHKCFVAAPNFSKMVPPFFLNDLGFTLELRSLSNFKTTGRTDYALEHPLSLIPYLSFTKLIVQHYMTAYPQISRRVHDKYHNLEHNEMVKSIFNSEKNKAGVGIKIPYVPTTQSQLIESTQGMHMTTTAPGTPNLDMNERESSAQRKSTVIRLRIPPRRSTRHTPSTPISTKPILTITEVEDLALQDTIQLSIAEQKSYEVFEAQKDVEKVKEHLQADEIEKMVKGTKTVDEDELVTSILDSQNDLKTSKNEGELRRREKGKHLEESRNTPSPTPIRSLRIHSTLISSDIEKL
nr:hypothetical protein [Tanacetum cinerariifolium]